MSPLREGRNEDSKPAGNRPWWQTALFVALLAGVVIVIGVLTRDRGLHAPANDAAPGAVDRQQTPPDNNRSSP